MHGLANLPADGLDRAKIAFGRDREAGLDDVDAELFESVSHLSFSWMVMLQPGDCSPSRKVVSKKITRSDVIDVPQP